MLKTYKTLKVNGQAITEHRIIVEEMLGRKLSSDEVVHHIDGNKWNNNPDNLMVVTRKEHALIHREEINRSKPVLQLDSNENVVKKWPSARAAYRETNISYQNIHKCCRGKRKTAGGYIWRYAQ